MENQDIRLQIGDFLGFVDLNGIDAVTSEQVQDLEEFVKKCNEAHNDGEDLVVDAIYDRLMEILRRVAPESELCKHIWEDSVDEIDLENDAVFANNPMYSIMTVKSFDCDEIKSYIDKLPEEDFEAHISVKLNGHGIRLVYKNGDFVQARSRARSSAGRDLTPQLKVILERDGLLHIDDIAGYDICEVRGEWVMPFENMDAARAVNPDIKSAFTAVSAIGKASGTEEDWNLLHFVAYEFLSNMESFFQSKTEEYEFIQTLGFEIPLYWTVPDLNKETLLSELPSIVKDCEEAVTGDDAYAYYTDGLVFSINDMSVFRTLGDDGSHYKFGNMALKVGYWKQDFYTGVIQTILWTKGKSGFSPVAIVAPDAEQIIFNKDENDDGDMFHRPYIMSQKEIANYSDLGVLTASGNKVRRVPLYDSANLIYLNAYYGEPIYFRYGGEAGVVPCFEDGTPLLEGKARQILASASGDDYYNDGQMDDGWEEMQYGQIIE